MTKTFQDLGYALRQLRRNPGFTLVAILTLALGIGANTAIFSVIYGVLLRPLPLNNSARLVSVRGKLRFGEGAISPADFVDYRAKTRSFTKLEAIVWGNTIFNFVSGDQPEQVNAAVVSSDFLATLGIEPSLGRNFSSADEQVSTPQVAILSHHLWVEHFGGSASVIGSTAKLDGNLVTITGVLPSDLGLPVFGHADIFVPIPFESGELKSRSSHFLQLIGLLQPGVGLAAAQAELDTIARRLEHDYPASNIGVGISAKSLQTALVEQSRPALMLLWAAVGLVLLIACGNVTNLLLARTTVRAREMAIRIALGGGRLRLVRQMLTENVVLFLAGGALGILLAYGALAWFNKLDSAWPSRSREVNLDGVILAFAIATAVFTALLTGVWPALSASRNYPAERLTGGGTVGTSKSRHRVNNALVAMEVAGACVVLIVSALVLNSLWRLVRVEPGFDPSGVVTAQIALTATTVQQVETRVRLVDQLQRKIAELPGVEAAGFISNLPFTGQSGVTYFAVGEHPPAGTTDTNIADFRSIDGNYFLAMRIPLLSGRGFSAHDTADADKVVVIDEPFARKYFSGLDPIGKHLQIYQGPFVSYEVVGVVGGMRNSSLREDPRPRMFVPFAQFSTPRMTLAVRTQVDPGTLSNEIRRAIHSVNPEMATSNFRTMDEILSGSTAGSRFQAYLLVVFAGIALMLTMAGIFGILSYIVIQRTREIGLRMALGAPRTEVRRSVVFYGLRLTVLGIAAGSLGALAVARTFSSLLFGVTPADPATFAVVLSLLFMTALLACYLPAIKASEIEPAIALRHD